MFAQLFLSKFSKILNVCPRATVENSKFSCKKVKLTQKFSFRNYLSWIERLYIVSLTNNLQHHFKYYPINYPSSIWLIYKHHDYT